MANCKPSWPSYKPTIDIILVPSRHFPSDRSALVKSLSTRNARQRGLILGTPQSWPAAWHKVGLPETRPDSVNDSVNLKLTLAVALQDCTIQPCRFTVPFPRARSAARRWHPKQSSSVSQHQGRRRGAQTPVPRSRPRWDTVLHLASTRSRSILMGIASIRCFQVHRSRRASSTLPLCLRAMSVVQLACCATLSLGLSGRPPKTTPSMMAMMHTLFPLLCHPRALLDPSTLDVAHPGSASQLPARRPILAVSSALSKNPFFAAVCRCQRPSL